MQQENLDECRELRLLLVYDEVHRLLPRFGGSGEGNTSWRSEPTNVEKLGDEL